MANLTALKRVTYHCRCGHWIVRQYKRPPKTVRDFCAARARRVVMWRKS